MAPQNLIDAINSLEPEQLESVRQFVLFLKQEEQARSARFQAEVDRFTEQHPDLLRRLAQ
jgi:hypothetical protein